MKLKLLLAIFISVFVGQNLFAAPAITSFTPASGPVGTLVTITGTGLNDPTAFTIGGVAAIVISNNGTKLVGMVMPGATKGPISVTAAGSSSVSQSDFTVIGTPSPNIADATIPVSGGLGSQTGLGTSVALSADGKTAVVGGPYDNNNRGAVWIYVKTGDVWAQQGGKLIGTGTVGDRSLQGCDVAISADGNTIIEGGYGDNNSVGAAWVFVRNGTTWAQQGDKLIGSGYVGSAVFGMVVALSADGNTAIIGGPNDNNYTGAMWTFTRSAGVWQQQGAKTPPVSPPQYAYFASSLALSADGTTAICIGSGRAWPFVRNGANWVFQGRTLGLGDPFGQSVALSADGNIALLMGSPIIHERTLYFFTRQNGNWTQQKDITVPANTWDIPRIFSKVTLTADGSIAMVSAVNSDPEKYLVTTYTRIANTWTSQGAAKTGIGQFGAALSISANGTAAIAGAPGYSNGKGEVVFFKANASPTKDQTITFALQSTAQYGDDDITLNAVSDKGLSVSYNNSDTSVATIVSGKLHIKTPGVVTITAYQPGNSTYKAALQVSRVLTINKAPLTIKADDKTGINTHTLPELSFTITGFVKNETVANLITAPVLNTTAESKSPVGTYPITVSGAASDNYDITYVQGTMTINASTAPAPVVTGFSPNSGIVGSLVKINGTDLDFATSLSIAGKPAVIVSNTSTQIVAMVMPGAVNGNISVATATGTSASTANFTVVSGQIPNNQQGLKLTGTSINEQSYQGSTIASSADGNTIIVGGSVYDNDKGAVWVYTRTGGSYTQQGPKITGAGSIGTGSNFGSSVAISADGNTAIIGGPADNNGIGAVWAFVRNGDTWVQQGPKITASGNIGNADIGSSVAISADGNTALVGGYTDNGQVGASWIFIRHNGVWTQQGGKLVSNDSYGLSLQGASVALSADGNTAVVGGRADFNGMGATWVYTRNGSVWSQQGPKLLGTGTVGKASQGKVAISADGNTILIGGSADDSKKGAAWVFIRNDGSWFQQGGKLIGTGVATSAGLQGASVALSADGNTAIIGGPGYGVTGAAWVFARNGATWTQHNQKLVGSNGGSAAQGAVVKISADGQTAFVGGPNSNAVWVFTPAAKQSETIDFGDLGTKNYGSADFSPSVFSTNDAVPLTFASSDTTTATVTSSGKIHIKSGGTVTITASQAGDADHTEAEPVGRTLTINKIPLTVTADNKTTTTGFSTVNFTARYQGFVNGDTTNNLTRQPVYVTTALKTSPAGYYTIMPDSAVSKSYYFIYKPGTLTVLAAHGPPQITAISPSSGPVGTLVTLTGSGLVTPESATIGSGNLLTLSASGNQLVGMVMPGAVSGPITFKTDSGTTTAPVNFTVTPSPYPSLEMGPKLLPADFGYSAIYGMQLSADGNTALVLGSNADKTYNLFSIVRNGDKWNFEDNLVTSLYAWYRVVLSADGNTAALVVSNKGENPGVLVFARVNGKWTQQSDKLVATNLGTSQTYFTGLSLSADGNTLVTGTGGGNWIFVRHGDRWVQLGDKLVSNEDPTGNDLASSQIALSGDGNTLIVAGWLNIWAFVRNGDYWHQQSKLFQRDRVLEIDAMELTADGNSLYLSNNGYLENYPYDGYPSTYEPMIDGFHRENGVWTYSGLVATGSLSRDYPSELFTVNANGETLLFSTYNNKVKVINAGANNVNLAATGTYITGIGLSLDGNIAFLNEGKDNSAGIRFFSSSEKQSQNITFGPIAPRTYGSTDTVLIASSANTALPITFASSDTTVATIVNNKIHIKAVGTTNITASQADPLVTPATQPFTVKQAQLTVTADDKTKAIGTENPPLTATYSGFVSNEDTTVIAVKPVLSTTATVNSLVGSYPITASGGSSVNYAFKYVPATLTVTEGTLPVVSAFSPSDITPGAVVTIIGANLGDATSVSFGGVPAASFTVVSANSITAVVGQGASGDIVVATGAGTAKASGIKYKAGQTITFADIAGKTTADDDFDPAATASSGLPVTYTSSNTAVATIVNGKVHIVGAGSSVIKAAQPGNDNFTAALSVSRTLTVKPAPLISSFSPADITPGTVVTITGANLGDATSVSFGGVPAASFTIVSANSITAVVGQGASGDIVVATSAGTAKASGIKYKAGQTITFAAIAAKTTADADFDPAATASSGLPVTYTSSNAAVATIVNGKVHIVGAGSSVIKAAQPGNDNYTAALSVSRTLTVKLPAPVITSFSPAAALKGTTVTITGTNLDQVTAVSFGGTAAASFTIVSPTSITAVVGTGTSGDIKLTAPGGTATLGGFEFVFDLPVNNFKLTITSATCKGSDNGSVAIAAVKSLNYTATITGGGLNQAYPFTKNATINNLAAGQYSVCIKVEGQSAFNQCYDVVITEPKDLSVYSTINPDLSTVTLALAGGDNYRIKLNGEQYTTTEASITLPVKTGSNQLEVTTDKLCQGLISKIINIEAKIIPYPNPFKNVINLNLGSDVIGKASVEISNLSTGGVLVYSNQYNNVSGVLQVNPGNLRNGVYVLKLTADNLVRVFKIVKQ